MYKHLYAAVPVLFSFFIYVITLHPSITFMDSGELAAVCYTFGIAHPTGYPLYLILGYIFSHFPLSLSVIYKLNLLSAIFTSSAVYVTFFNSELLLRNLIFSRKVKKEKISFSDKEIFIAASVSSFSCALVASFWFNATQNEVYSLNLLFISIIFYYLIKIYFAINHQTNYKNWALLFLFLGLSFANHLTTVYFIPALIFLIYLQYNSDKVNSRKILNYILLVIPGLLLYGILMLRASSEPFFNWSDPHNLSNLIRHIRGQDYSQLMFSSGNVFSLNLLNFLKEIHKETGIISGIAGILGFAVLWKKQRKLFFLFMLIIFTSLLISFNYNIIDINSYYAAAYYTLVLLSGTGLIYTVSRFKGNLKLRLIIANVLIVALFMSMNFSFNDNSSNYANEDYTLGILNNLDQGSVLLTMQFADVYSGSMYFQHVENRRTDVKVFMLKFLSAPWFLKTIEKYYPDIYDLIKSEADQYIMVYDSDSYVRSTKLNVLVEKFIDKISAKYPLYFTVDLILDKDLEHIVKKLKFIPDGLVYRYTSDNTGYISDAGIRYLGTVFREIKPNSYHKKKLYNLIPGVYYETAFYHYKHGNSELAMRFLEKSLSVNPDFSDAVHLKNKIIKERKN